MINGALILKEMRKTAVKEGRRPKANKQSGESNIKSYEPENHFVMIRYTSSNSDERKQNVCFYMTIIS